MAVSPKQWDILTPFLFLFGLVALCDKHVALAIVFFVAAVIGWRRGT
jgi:hypothetical protein